MKKRFGKIAYILVISVCIVCIVISGMLVLSKNFYQEKEEQLIGEIQAKRQESEITYEEESEEAEEPINCIEAIKVITSMGDFEIPKIKPILQEYKALHEENGDMYGWIKIDDTVIDYPVMYTPNDPNFYEDKNWNKEVCYSGVGTCIWMDGWVTEDSENTIIYGHDMADYSMFGSLCYYKDPSYYENHKYIRFDTLYEKQIYEIISVSKGIVYYDTKPEGEYLFYDHLELNSEEEFKAYVDNAKQKAWFDINETAEYGDKLITLCTCDGWTTDGRLFIVAKEIDN